MENFAHSTRSGYPTLSITNRPKELLFEEFILDQIARSRKGENFCKSYRVVAKHIHEFSEKLNMKIYAESMSDELLEEFIFYMQSDKKMMISTVKTLVEKTKCMLNRAHLRGLKVDHSFRDVKVKDEEIETIYLSITDIARIYYAKGLSKKQEEIRDLFVVGCLTGLRYSDFSRLNREHIIAGKIHIRTQKTHELVIVPMHRFVKEIVDKYDGAFPRPRCIQYFNSAIKKICKIIGLTEMVKYERRIGLEYVSRMRPKYELISTHTGRRSAVTNLHLQGVDLFTIKQMTGHKTDVILRYIRVNREQSATKIESYMNATC